MNKRLSGVCLCLAMVFFITVAISSVAFATEKPIKWRFAIMIPRGLNWSKIYDMFPGKVEAMSGGRLQIQSVFDGEGVIESAILTALESGLIEIGTPYQGMHANELPAGIVEMGLPGGPESFSELLALFQLSGWKNILREAYAKHNVYWLGEYYQPKVYVLTKKPIKTIDDFKKLKIRAPGAYGKALRNLGVSPVVISYSEIYTSLATGVVDGVTGGTLIDDRDSKFYEVAPYIYPLPLTGAQIMPLAVNLKEWNKLPDDLKEILKTAASWFGQLQMAHSVVWEKEALDDMLSKGAKMSPKPSGEDKKEWKEAGMKVWEEFESKDKFCKEMIEIQRQFLKKIGY
jgi:TRAP-type C4-dicarboxylate transport system substrate-binding protein